LVTATNAVFGARIDGVTASSRSCDKLFVIRSSLERFTITSSGSPNNTHCTYSILNRLAPTQSIAFNFVDFDLDPASDVMTVAAENGELVSTFTGKVTQGAMKTFNGKNIVVTLRSSAKVQIAFYAAVADEQKPLRRVDPTYPPPPTTTTRRNESSGYLLNNVLYIIVVIFGLVFGVICKYCITKASYNTASNVSATSRRTVRVIEPQEAPRRVHYVARNVFVSEAASISIVGKEQLTCPICLDTLEELRKDGVSIMFTPCCHALCEPCANKLLASQTDPVCPMCRGQLVGLDG